MAYRRFHLIHKVAACLLLLAGLMLLSACGQKTPPPKVTPTRSATTAPTQTATPTPPPASTATQTSTPLPKDPTLLAIIGKGKVYATAWSPDRQAFAVSAADGVRLYQAKTHRVLAEFPQPGGARVAFSPDGQKLAVFADIAILIYDLRTHREVAQVEVGFSMTEFAFKIDGSGFAISNYLNYNMAAPGYSWIAVYDLQSDTPRYEFDKEIPEEGVRPTQEIFYRGVAFSPDGRWLSAADYITGQVRTWDLTTGQRLTRKMAHPYVASVVYSPDGRWLASGGDDNTVRIWDAAAGRLARTLGGFSENITSLSFSADSSMLAVEAGSPTEWYNAATGQKVHAREHPDKASEIPMFLAGEGYMEITGQAQFSPDGRILAIPNGNRLVLWDWQAQRQQAALDTRAAADRPVVFSPDGRLLAVPHSGGSVDLWDAAGGQRVKHLPSHKAMAIAFSADGKTLAVGGPQAVELWDVASGQRQWQYHASGLLIDAVAFSQDGQTILATSAGQTVLWLAAASGEVRQTFQPDPAGFWSMTITQQERLLAVVKREEAGPLQVWDLSSGQVLQDISGYQTECYSGVLTFTTDGRLLAQKGCGNVKIWSTATGQALFEFPEGLGEPVFSPDQQWLVFPDEYGRLQVWDARPLARQAPELPVQTARPLPTPAPTNASCLTIQPALSPHRKIQGRLVMGGMGGVPDYLLDLANGGQRALPDNIYDLSTSPSGEWLMYRATASSRVEKDWLVFEDTSGRQRQYPFQEDWLFPIWLGNDWLSYSIRVDYNGEEISPTQIISPRSGPARRLLSNYPGLDPFSGGMRSPYHYGTHSVAYDPSLRLVVYEKADNEGRTSMVLYNRVSGKTLASLPSYYGQHESNNPEWSVDGQFFIAPLIKDYQYQPGAEPGQEELFRINRDGSLEQLTYFADPVNLWQTGSLSPDGKKYAFYLNGSGDGSDGLTILDLESKSLTATCLGSGDGLVWSPDSRYLVAGEEYETNFFRTILIDLDTYQAEQVVDDEHAIPAGWLNAR